jgi:DNA-binding CsgD family transcriptional regulator
MQRSSQKAPFVVGVLDANGCVRQITGDIAELLGYEPSECVGSRAVSIVHEDDRSLLDAAESERMELRVRHRSGSWLRAAAVIAPLHPPETEAFTFVLTAFNPSTTIGLESRVAALEARLRRIALEAGAAGLGDSTSSAAFNEDSVGLLSPRQADIAQRLTAGKRVPTIARDMGLSQSTVRNHLSQIFRKFGVASQAELVEALQRDTLAERDTVSRGE